jgi:hypothetical protein
MEKPEKPKFNKQRKYAALGLSVVTLAAGSVKSTEAKPLQGSGINQVADYEIYKNDKRVGPQEVTIYQDDQVPTANKYLTPANIRQSVTDTQELAGNKPDISVSLTAFGQSIALDYEVGPMMEVAHNFYILSDAKSIQLMAQLAQPTASITQRVYLHGGMDSYVAPVGNDLADGLNLAKEVCSSMVDVNFTDETMNKLNKLFGGQITGSEYLEMKDAARAVFCMSYGAAAAGRMAGFPYNKYKNIVSNNNYSDKLDQPSGANFKIGIPVLSQTDWQAIQPLKPGKFVNIA